MRGKSFTRHWMNAMNFTKITGEILSLIHCLIY
jgi:hypothetical protein